MKYDVCVIGGGPSGMSAALSAYNNGSSVLLIERDCRLGGILNQCIHNGFGLSYFKEELTGPEYAQKLIDEISKTKIEVKLNSFVVKVEQNYLEYISPNGYEKVEAKAIVFCLGCRERTAGAISLPSKRQSGIFTAGTVQKMINHYGKLPGKSAVILGSGDIGLIMARRMKFEGMEVKSIFEIMSTSSGLPRNIRQCVEDFDIPILYNHTITSIVGNNRVQGIYYAKVDEKLQPIKETEKYMECDTVVLSVGLIPENELIYNKVMIDNRTKSAIVDEKRMTSINGIFISGNVLHIHDLADNATIEGSIAGKNASEYSKKPFVNSQKVDIVPLDNISYCIPQKANIDAKDFTIFFRSKTKLKNKKLIIKNGNEILVEKMLLVTNPGVMQEIKVKELKNNENISIQLI